MFPCDIIWHTGKLPRRADSFKVKDSTWPVSLGRDDNKAWETYPSMEAEFFRRILQFKAVFCKLTCIQTILTMRWHAGKFPIAVRESHLLSVVCCRPCEMHTNIGIFCPSAPQQHIEEPNTVSSGFRLWRNWQGFNFSSLVLHLIRFGR